MQPLLRVVSDLLFVEWKEWKRDESDTVHFLRCRSYVEDTIFFVLDCIETIRKFKIVYLFARIG